VEDFELLDLFLALLDCFEDDRVDGKDDDHDVFLFLGPEDEVELLLDAVDCLSTFF
jgi:hypothetical protein